MRNTQHLASAFLAFFVLAVALIAFKGYAKSLEQKSIHVLVTRDLEQTLHGSVLQRMALLQPDLLLVYGSSELVFVHTSYESANFFKNYPTGFATMEIADAGMSSIIVAQQIAALGTDLRGKKIVISFTPEYFTRGDAPNNQYTGNFELGHAYEMIFSPYLNLGLKSAAARRMLEFPNTLQSDPFLNLVLQDVADPSLWHTAVYYLTWPLGEFQTMIMRIQDHAAVVAYMWSHRIGSGPPHIPGRINWKAVLATAAADQVLYSLNNPYGVEDPYWQQYQNKLINAVKPGSGDAKFLRFLPGTKEWSDLQILLGVLHELGAQSLILSRPMNVHLWEAFGVSEGAQNAYYSKLHAVVAPYSMPVVDYREYGTDIYFSIDLDSHTSRKGWVYVDQTLDEFFHGLIH